MSSKDEDRAKVRKCSNFAHKVLTRHVTKMEPIYSINVKLIC